MRALKSVRLQNFQSHKDTLITFAKEGCLTVITGPSDSGKSAVIRALRWVFYNVTQGDGFIFNAEDKCTVTLTYDDGAKVERIRSRGGINRYVVNGQTLEGFGIGVPLEVQQATGIRKLEIGDQSFLLNLSEQLDGPFLGKSVSGPARAKVLGKLAGTEEIDYAGKEIGTDIYRAKREKEGLESYIAAAEKDLKGYAWVLTREAQLAELEIHIKNIKDSQERATQLKGLQEQAVRIGDIIGRFKNELTRLQPTDEGLVLIREAGTKSLESERLVTLNQSKGKATSQIHEANAVISQLKDLGFVQITAAVAQNNLSFGNEVCELWRKHLLAYASKTASEETLEILTKQYQSALPYIAAAEKDAIAMEALNQLATSHEDTCLIELALRRTVQNTKRLGEVQEATIFTGKAVEQLSLIRSEQAKINSLNSSISMYSLTATHAQTEVEFLESEYIQVMTELGKCPTCGGSIHIEKLREVI